MSNPSTPAGKGMPLSLYFGWGLGTLGLTAFMVGSYLLLRFMTDYMAVPPALAGLIFALAKIYDGIADPIFGSISDRFRSKWGRRRPFLLMGAFACGLTFMLAFNAPIIHDPRGAAVLLAVLLMLHATSYAIFAVPYMAMPAEMTDSPHERSKLMSFRVVNGSVGNWAGGAATAFLIAFFGGGLAGHRGMAIVIGLVIFAVMIGCFLLTKPARIREVDPLTHPPYLEQLKQASQNRPFVILQGAKLMLLSAAGIHTASAAFFVQRRLEASDNALGLIFTTLIVGTLAAQPFWLWAARRFGKRDTYTCAALFSATVWCAWLLVPAGASALPIIAVGLLAGLGNGGVVMISQSMLPDTIQYQFQKTGSRIEGSFAGLYIMIEKLGQAIGVSMTGIVLGAFGYVQARAGQQVEQPPSAVLGVALCYTVFSAAFLLCSVLVMRFYPLDERTMTLRGDAVGRAEDPPDVGTTGTGA